MSYSRIVFAMLLLFSTSGPGLGQEKASRHVEKEGGFSFVPPQGWRIMEFPGWKYKIAAGPISNGFAANILFSDEATNLNRKEYVSANMKVIPNFFKNPKTIGESELKTSDGTPCSRVVIKNDHDGKRMRQSFYFFQLLPRRMHVATCTALAENGAELDTVFEDSMKTVQMEKK